jgi:SAM-dependent methyltransferase
LHVWILGPTRGPKGASAHSPPVMKGPALNVFNLPIFNNRAGYRAGIEDYLFEKMNRLSLEGIVSQEILKSSVKSNLKHATYYQPITCRNLKIILDKAAKTKIPFDCFIDIGSGKGKACFFAAQTLKCRKFIGVEFSLSLVKTANRNKTIFDDRNISFLNEDAATYTLPDSKCLIFLYNPFNDVILEKFVANNYGHFRRHASIIAYAYDVHRETLLLNGFRTIFRAADRKLSLYQFKTPKALS